MNAKEALLFELGDFGMDAAIEDAKEDKVEGEAIEEEIVEPNEEVVIGEMRILGEKESAEKDEDSDSNLTIEEIEANIDAINDTLVEPSLPQESFDWGMKRLKKMYKLRAKKIREMIDSIDWEERRKEFEEADRLAEEAEQAKKEEYINQDANES